MDGKKRRNLIIGALVILAVLAGAFCWNGGLPNGSQPAASENTGTLAEQDRGEQTGSEKEDAEYGFSGNAGSKLSAEEKIEAAEKIAENTPSQAPAKSGVKSENTQTVQTSDPGNSESCILSISCASVLARMDWLNPAKTNLIPKDGWILSPVSVSYKEGDSAFDVLQRTCREKGIHMEFQKTPAYNSVYIEGINNLYEFDCGDLSGWMFKVNGSFLNYSSSLYKVQSGDELSFVYSCDLGVDQGGFSSAVQ